MSQGAACWLELGNLAAVTGPWQITVTQASCSQPSGTGLMCRAISARAAHRYQGETSLSKQRVCNKHAGSNGLTQAEGAPAREGRLHLVVCSF